MNDRINNAGIVLTTGVLLGWASSAALATNIVGVGDYRDLNGGAGAAFEYTDAVVRTGAGNVIIWDSSSPTTFFTEWDAEGSVSAFDIITGGSGYNLDGNIQVTTDPEDPNAAFIAAEASEAAGTWAIDGVAGTYSPAQGNITIVQGGTGYDLDTNNLTAILVDGNGDALDCATGGGTDFAAGSAGVSAGFVLALVNGVWAAPGAAANSMANITVDDGGFGYGNCAAGCAMTVEIDGVVTTDIAMTYTTDAAGTILAIDGVTGDVTTNNVIEGLTQGSQIRLTPATVDNDAADVNGSGFNYTIQLFGEITAFDNVTPGVGCPDAANVQPEAAGAAVIPAEVVGGPGNRAVFAIGANPTGAVTSTAVTVPGANYTLPPVIGFDDGVATFTEEATGRAVLWSGNGSTVTLANGIQPVINAEWDITTRGDFNADGRADLLLHNLESGSVQVWNNLNGDVWEAVEVGTAGGGWAVTGLLVDDRTGAASSIFWHKTDTGANAVWMVDTSAAAQAAGSVLNVNSALTTAVPSYWEAACTNNSLETGDNVYFYSTETGRSALWNMSVNSSPSDLASYIVLSDAQYLVDGTSGDAMVAGENWMIAGVGAGSGADNANDRIQAACDIVWCNTVDQRVAMWMCNPAANWQSNGEGFVQYNGSAAAPSAGNELVGIGQYNILNANYGTDGAGATLQKTYRGMTMVWNNAGINTIWQMSTQISPAAFDQVGTSTAGTGNIANPDHIVVFNQY